MNPATCPSSDRLAAFVLGKLPKTVMRDLTHHTLACTNCQARLEQADNLSDGLIRVIRYPGPGSQNYTEPQLDQLLDRVQDLCPRTAMTPPEPTPDVEPPANDFLDPPQGPDEIGWIGTYRLLGILGKGGMGVVYRAEDTQLHRPVALKVLKATLAGDDAARKRLWREAQSVAALGHKHVATVYQIGEHRGTPFLAMELLEGETLADRLRRAEVSGQTTLHVPEILRIGREIAEGLAAAHEHGLMHRDVKPSNVWLESRAQRP